MVISDLLWRRPRHYMDVDETHDRVHWVELFFDLVHVVTIFILGNYLSHHLGWQGFWVFTGLFLAIFYAGQTVRSITRCISPRTCRIAWRWHLRLSR